MKKPYSAYANLALAGYCNKHGLRNEALANLAAIPDRSFAAAQKYELLADLMISTDIDGAIKAYEKSLFINSGRLRPRKKLYRIFERTDPERAAEELRKLVYISSFYGQS